MKIIAYLDYTYSGNVAAAMQNGAHRSQIMTHTSPNQTIISTLKLKKINSATGCHQPF